MQKIKQNFNTYYLATLPVQRFLIVTRSAHLATILKAAILAENGLSIMKQKHFHATSVLDEIEVLDYVRVLQLVSPC